MMRNWDRCPCPGAYSKQMCMKRYLSRCPCPLSRCLSRCAWRVTWAGVHVQVPQQMCMKRYLSRCPCPLVQVPQQMCMKRYLSRCLSRCAWRVTWAGVQEHHVIVVAVGHHIAVITADQQAQNLFYKSIINQNNQRKIYHGRGKVYAYSC